MRLVDIVLPTAAENLALDEAMLEEAESIGSSAEESLRLWESPEAAVVIGRSSRVEEEVNLPVCRELGIPVLRRCSGGAAVVIGPGCLMYSVVLSYARRPALRMIENAHRHVLGQQVAAVAQLKPGVVHAGTSDLVWAERKFSGNSLRCKRSNLLYHGTLLYDFPLELIGDWLRVPPRQPAYRCNRAHDAFVTNLGVGIADLREEISKIWQVRERRDDWPAELTGRLLSDRYSLDSWNLAR